ncbi:MAG: caspase family protein [Armatimonadetes bacterium]|nr:caspase family protein [Armatimonadota bacterium]
MATSIEHRAARARRTFWALALWLLGCLAAGAENQPRLVLQNGHSESIKDVDYSADGAYLATAAEDGTAKIWDARTGKVLLTLVDPAAQGAYVTDVEFHPGGRQLATGSGDGCVRIWDAATGELVRKWRCDAEEYGAPLRLAFSPSGDALVTVAARETLQVWDPASGKARLSWTAPQKAQWPPDLQSVAFSSDGAYLAAGGYVYGGAGTYLLDGRTYAPKGFLPHPADQEIGAVVFSPDSKRLAAVGESGRIAIYDPGKGSLVKDFQTTLLDTSAAWIPSGLLLGSDRADNPMLSVWDPQSGQKTATLIDPEGNIVYAVAVTPDGKQAAAAHANWTVSVWDLSSRKQAMTLQGHSTAIYALDIDPAGRYMISGSRTGALGLWDLAQGKLVRTLEGLEASITAVDASPAGDLVAGCDWYYGQLVVWNLSTGARVSSYKLDNARSREGFTSLAFSSDGRNLAVGQPDGAVIVLDPAAGKRRSIFKPVEDNMSARKIGEASDVAFSPDGKLLAASYHNATVREWDVASRQLVHERRFDTWGISSGQIADIAYSPDGKLLAAAARDGKLHIWETEYDDKPTSHTVSDVGLTCLAFSPDSTEIAAGAWDRAVHVTRLADGQSRAYSDHFDTITQVVFTPDGRRIVSASSDTSIKFWGRADGKLLATALQLDEGKNWVVTTPDGHFDGSPEGQRLIEWRIGDRLYALDQFYNDFYVPGLLARIAGPTGSGGNGQASLPAVSLKTREIKPPPRVSIVSPRPGDQIASGHTTVVIEIQDQGGGFSRPRVYHNGHRLPESRAVTRGGTVSYEVELAPGKNTFLAKAFNAQGDIESRGDRVGVVCTAEEARQPALHVLAVGIDRYEAGLQLGFARSDAESIARSFKPGLFQDVNVHLMTDAQATRQGILSELEKLGQKAQPQDALLVYLAGHGTVLGDIYYFLPYDARVDEEDAIRSSALSSIDLADALSGVPATKQLVVLDSCHSGAAAGALGKYLASRDALGLIRAQQNLARSSGTFLIAASTAEQYAKEFPELGHGVLTYAFLTGLGLEGGAARAATQANGEVTVNALLNYLSQQVPSLTEKYHGGRQDIVQYSTGQDFPLVIAQ